MYRFFKKFKSKLISGSKVAREKSKINNLINLQSNSFA